MGELVNTEERETFPFISDKDVLYYSSDGKLGLGGLDIFKAILDKKGDVMTVRNMKRPINSSSDDFGFIVNNKMSLGLMSSNRDGDLGSSSDEIYKLDIVENPIIKGQLTALEIEDVLEDKVMYLRDAKGTKLDSLSLRDDGKFAFQDEVEEGGDYILTIDKSEDFKGIEKVKVEGEPKKVSAYVASKDCPDNNLNCVLKLKEIYFDVNKSYIKKMLRLS